ncbi:glycan synthetase, putative [Eimeria brunetti]|uniref:Glycan synthetase, putative n=1 Tax=Eimeria brunetti TaxID=51314 RepID=U6LTH5_9EIME|nr:glycan synthetase, putative [Eimeria brunetti]
MTGPIGTGGFASLGHRGAETEAARAGRRQDEERQQYITKIPSSSFLRTTPERAGRLNAADALFAVPVSEQQRLVERFIDYAEHVRGAQLHLLRGQEGSAVTERFLQQVERLQQPFAAADAKAEDAEGPSHSNGVPNGSSSRNTSSSESVSDGSSSGGGAGGEKSTAAAAGGTKECLRGQQPSVVRFRLIEGAVSSLMLGGGAGTVCGSHVQTRVSPSFQGGDSDAVTHGSSTISTNGEGEEEEALFACQLESFLELAADEIATKELVGWEGQTEKNAAAVQLRCRKVIMAGALVPLALDDTLVIEQKVTLRRGTVSLGSNGAATNGAPAEALDAVGDIERLRDVLHQHAYQGCLRVPVTEQFKVQRGGRRGSTCQELLASVVVLARADEPRCLSIFYHFKDQQEGSFIVESPEWMQMQEALAPLLASREILTFRGLLHTRREQTGLCYGPPVGLEVPAFTPLRAPRDTCDWSSQLDGSAVVQLDPKLQEFVPQLRQRFLTLTETLSAIKRSFSSLKSFAEGYKVFGLQRGVVDGVRGVIYREWLPNATAAYLFGDFNNWDRNSHPLQRERRGVSPYFFETSLGALKGADATAEETFEGQPSSVWSIFLPDNPDGSPALAHRCRLRVLVVPREGDPIDRVPSWSRVVWRSEDSGLFNGVFWDPPAKEKHVFRHSRPRISEKAPAIYEAHIGSSSGEEGRVGTFVEFTKTVLPRIKNLSYNTVLLLDVVEHADFASFGIYVTNHFAVSSRLGTVEEFKALVDKAHALGLRVLINLSHAHSSKNVMDGLGCIDGGDNNYFVSGPSGVVEEAKVFDFSKTEVVRFLLSNIAYWITEFQIDGFRFDGVPWILYGQRSVLRQPDLYDYSSYLSRDLCASGVLYLSLANSLLSSLLREDERLSIAQECTGYPTLCRGGLGFDYRLDSSLSQSLRRLIRQSGRRQGRWMTAQVLWALASKPNTEKVLVSVEDADTTRFCRRRLKIALFAWESLHTHAVGGVAPHVTELAAGLSRQGHEVHVFVRAMESVPLPHASCAQGRTAILTMHSTEFGRCGNNNYGGVSKRIRDIEVSSPCFSTLFCSVSRAVAEACHMADRVICVSGVLAEEVRAQYGVHPAKMTVIYNGINCNKFDGEVDPGAVKHTYGVGALDPMFLFVGRMVVQKGPDLLLEAVPFIHKFRWDAKFVFVGDGHMMESLKGRAAQLGVTHAVRFVGKMGGGALHALFKSCDAVVVPSRNEPFGIVVLEAWSASKPVVATNSGGPRDFVNPNITVSSYLSVCAVIAPQDPTPGSIAWGCCEILKNFEHARWMGSRGRVTAAFSFSWDSIAQQTREIYYEQRNKHDTPPNWSYSSEGDDTLAFALIGPAMYEHMSVDDCDPHVLSGLALWRLYRLLGSGLGDGRMNFMGNEFAHPDGLDLPRPANHFSMAKAFRRWNLAENPALKFTQCELFDCCLNHWESIFGWQSATHLYVVKCDEEAQVVVLERGECLFAFNFHPHNSYEGFHVGCMYNEPMRLFLDSDERRFGGFGRLIPKTQHPVTEAKDSRPHSVRIYLPSSTCAVYVRESLYCRKKDMTNLPVLSMEPEAYVDYRNVDKSWPTPGRI